MPQGTRYSFPVRNHTVQDSSRGRRKGVVPRTPPDRATRHGNRGVVTRARLGDLNTYSVRVDTVELETVTKETNSL